MDIMTLVPCSNRFMYLSLEYKHQQFLCGGLGEFLRVSMMPFMNPPPPVLLLEKLGLAEYISYYGQPHLSEQKVSKHL